MDNDLFHKLFDWAVSKINEPFQRRAVVAVIEIIRDAIEKSETKVDDKLILPVIELIEKNFSLSDGQNGTISQQTRDRGFENATENID